MDSSPQDTTVQRLPLPPAEERARAGDWVRLVRARQWTKNLVVAAGLVFSGSFTQLHAVLLTGAAFVVFCALSSAGYVINDILDRQSDRAHPVKRMRPIAAGRIGPRSAAIVATLLLVGGLLAAVALDLRFAAVAFTYVVLSFTYSQWWKHLVIIDLMVIAAGFVLRAAGGTVILHVTLSPWLFVCVMFLALLLGFGKRRHEFNLLDGAHIHRPVLEHYSRHFIDHSITLVSGGAVMTYAVYAISSPTALHYPWLVLTVPFVIYGVLRFLYLIFHRELGGQPEELLLTDRPLLLSVVLWGLASMAVFWGHGL
jgi:4-hydroxybenzoate polyprenyltransferase